MADVFLSYVSEDRVSAEKISHGLEGAGLSVWWDRHIRGGVDFSKEIEQQLGAARVVIVLWSAASLDSTWVRDEAQHARDENKLIPVRLDGAQPPLGFRQAQALDLRGWNGDPTAGAFARLVDSARHFLGETAPVGSAATTPPAHISRPRLGISKVWIVAVTTLVVVAGAIAVVLMRTPSPSMSELTNGRVELGTFDLLTKGDDAVHFGAGLRDRLEHTFAANGIKSVASSDPAAQGTGPTSELLLRGSIDREQDKFKVSADLVRRPEGLLLWSIATQQGESDAAASVQQRFAVAVTDVLQCALRNRSNAKDDPSADLFAKLLQWCAIIQGHSGQISQLEGLANDIVETAPQYAISYAIKAISNAVLAGFPALPGILLKPEAEQARLRKVVDESAEAARQMEPQNRQVEALVDWALANKLSTSLDLSASMRLLEKSMTADPQFGPARFGYAMNLSALGRIDEARIEVERAAGLLPLAWYPGTAHANLVAAFGNVAAGRQELIDVERRTGYEDVNVARFWLEYWYGDPRAAKAYASRLRMADFVLPGFTEDGIAVCLDALLNARIERKKLPRAQFDAVCTNATPGFPATFDAERGDVDAAYGELKAWEGWYAENSELVQTLFMPYMRSVRADVRFMPFAASIGLVDYWLDSGHFPDFCATEKLPYDCKEAALAARANATK